MVKQESILQMIEAYKRFWRLEKKYSDLLGDDNEVYREIFELQLELQKALNIDDEIIECILDINFDVLDLDINLVAERIANYHNNKERLV